ncbi:DNRLRE domain-containing protein [Streptodolium elevatio]
MVLALVAGLSLGGVSAAAATGAPDVERPDKPRPTQETGSAAGRPHEVGTEQTRFDESAAGGPGAPASNELPPEESLLPVPVESKGHSPEPSQSAPVVQSVPSHQQGPAVGMNPSSAPPRTPKAPASSSYDPATSTEVVAERGERTQVFDNADGSRTLRVSEEPVNFLTQDGRWEPIDTTLVTAPGSSARAGVASADQGRVQGGWQTKAGAYPVAIAGAANSPTLATMRVGNGQSAGFGLDGATPATGRADRDTVTFSGVRDMADLTLQANEGSLKETIHLQSRQSPDTWTFPLALEGLLPSLDEAGNVALKDAAGEVRAVIPAGWMMDSAVNPATGDGVTSGGVSYALIERAPGAWALKVTLDRAWLDDPRRVYPVKVDPTLQVTPAANSVSIVQGRNYFQTDVYRLGYNCDGGVCNNAAILLNTGSVSTTLKDHLITGARLNLWNVHTYDCQAPRAVTVHANTAAWNPSTVRYPGPSYGGALSSATFGRGNESDGCGDGWGVVDLGTAGANAIQGWANGQPNHGLTVRTALNDPRTWKKFDTAPNNGVKLDIDYTPRQGTAPRREPRRPRTTNASAS